MRASTILGGAIGLLAALSPAGPAPPTHAETVTPRDDDAESWAASHFRVADPARLTGEEAARVYATIRPVMTGLYAVSRRRDATAYTSWPRYVTAPYLTTAHGNRYHNVYARSAGARYGHYEAAGPMPAGTVVAKDSFSVTSAGQIRPGPLSIMEKLPPGANPTTGDWRFTEILPDGSVFGETGGEQAENVAHCVACHRAVADTQDWLYFPPSSYRVPRER